jgi:hypothetical protein
MDGTEYCALDREECVDCSCKRSKNRLLEGVGKRQMTLRYEKLSSVGKLILEFVGELVDKKLLLSFLMRGAVSTRKILYAAGHVSSKTASIGLLWFLSLSWLSSGATE